MGFNSTFVEKIAELDETCGYKSFREQYYAFPLSGVQPHLYFNSTKDANCDLQGMGYSEAYHPNPCFDVYEIGLQCPLLSDPLGYPTDLQYSYPGLPIYFNRTDVKAALHAPMEVEWLECAPRHAFVGEGGPQNEGDLSADPIQSVLPKVIEKTNRVLVSNGNLDYEIITNGTLLAIQNMTWNGAFGFQSKPGLPIHITLPDLVYGDVFISLGFSNSTDNP